MSGLGYRIAITPTFSHGTAASLRPITWRHTLLSLFPRHSTEPNLVSTSTLIRLSVRVILTFSLSPSWSLRCRLFHRASPPRSTWDKATGSYFSGFSSLVSEIKVDRWYRRLMILKQLAYTNVARFDLRGRRGLRSYWLVQGRGE